MFLDRLVMFCVCLLLLCAAVTSCAFANQAPVMAERYFEPGETLVTPHIEWLKPYYGGKIKALFIVPRTGVREVVELAQRMDLEYKVFAMYDPTCISRKGGSEWVPGEDTDAREDFLYALLKQDYDVIVIGNCRWTALPEDARYKILKKVKNGAGLAGHIDGSDEMLNTVLSKTSGDAERKEFEDLLAGFTCRSGIYQRMESADFNIPAEMLNRMVQTATFGKGKVCLFKYESAPKNWKGPFHVLVPGTAGAISKRNPNDYDYQMAFVIRSILWVSSKEPAVSIMPETPFLSVRWEDTTSAKAVFNLIRKGDINGGLSGNFFILNSFGEKIFEKTQFCNQGNDISFLLPQLPIGTYRANLIVKAGGGAVNFASSIIEVTGTTCIAGIKLAGNSFLKSEAVAGTISLANPAPNFKLNVNLFDNYGRLTQKQVFPADRGEIPFSIFPSGEPLTISQTIRADLISGDGRCVHSVRKYYTISNIYAPADEMRAILWNELAGGGTLYTLPVLKYWKSCGIDTHYVNFSEYVTQANLWEIPILTRLIDEKTDWYPSKIKHRTGDDLVRQPCLTDPAYRDKLLASLAESAKSMKDFSIREFSLGDECHFCGDRFDLCFSPTCVADFKRFVQEKYRTVGNLNAEYGTDYKSFDEVEPLPIDLARQQNQIARWVDHRLHMDSVWAGTIGNCAGNIKKVVPAARVGYEGSDFTPNSWYASDNWELSRVINLNSLYFDPFQVASWNSMHMPDTLLGMGWFGGYNSPYAKKHNYESQYMPWATLLSGDNSLWIWHANPAEGSVTTPDYEFYDFFQDALLRTREIKSGLDKVLLRAVKQTDTGIYYSPASVHTATFLESPVGTGEQYQDVAKLMLALRLEPRIYAYEEVKQSVLKREMPRVLYLPYCLSLSPDEVKGIREYVSAGGILIADMRPGVRDEHGKLLPFQGLCDVFGVKFSDEGALKQGAIDGAGGNKIMVWYDPSVVLANGRAQERIEGTPALISNTFGKGKAVLLNFYPHGTAQAKSSSYETIIGDILLRYGIHPEVTTKTASPGLDIKRFKSGKIEYVTLFQDYLLKSGEPVGGRQAEGKDINIPDDKPYIGIDVLLPHAAYLYSIRDGKYLGYGSNVKLNVQSLEPVILAMMPYKIQGITLSAASLVEQGQALRYEVGIKIGGDARPEEHIVRIDVFNPNGQKVEYYGSKLAIKGSQKQVLQLAVNENPGRWTLVATDLISGITAKAYFTVERKPVR